MPLLLVFLYYVFATCLFPSAQAVPTTLSFNQFLKEYQQKSRQALSAEQNLARSLNTRTQSTDQWKSRLTATPQLGFTERQFESGGGSDISNRSQSITGKFSQSLPTGTNLEVNAQKFIENQNPLFQSIDRSYSLKVSQDLIKNSFGRSQRALRRKADLDYQVAKLNYRQSKVQSCEEAFNLYSDTFIQQEITQLLQSQLKDARKAQKISRRRPVCFSIIRSIINKNV